MGLFLEIILIFLTIAGLVTFFLMRYLYRRPIASLEDITGNEPKIINLMPEFTNGHALFLEMELRTGKQGRKLAYLYPTDNKFEPEHKRDKPIEMQKIILKPGQRIAFPTGAFSDHSEIVLYNVIDPEKIPEGIKNTILGNYLRINAIKSKVEDDETKIKEWKERTKSLILSDEYDWLNISRKDYEERIKEMRRISPEPIQKK